MAWGLRIQRSITSNEKKLVVGQASLAALYVTGIHGSSSTSPHDGCVGSTRHWGLHGEARRVVAGRCSCSCFCRGRCWGGCADCCMLALLLCLRKWLEPSYDVMDEMRHAHQVLIIVKRDQMMENTALAPAWLGLR